MGCGANDNNKDQVADNNNGPLDVNYDTRNTRDWDNTRNDLTYRNNGNQDGYGATGVRNDTRDHVGDNDNNDRHVDVADDIADQVSKLKEVDRAYVLTTGKNAYVAVKLTNDQNDKLSNDVKNKIADKARKADRNLDNVFVSENPDFFGQMRGYRDELNNGNPVSGFFDQFSDTVERVFPSSR
nr:YhcN/YlaJ family sporulation lipoprotein [Lederbergia galactosidilytica]